VHRSVVPLDAEAARPRRSAAASAGNLVYLTSVGIVAAAIAGVFFSAGFLLLAPPAGGAMSHSDLRVPDRQDRSLHPDISPPSGSDIRPADSMLGAVAVKAPIPIGLTPPASPDNTPSSATPEASPDRVLPVVEPTVTPLREASAQAESSPASPRNTGTAPAQAPPGPRLSGAEISELLGHGDALLRSGDLTSARLFYERAAAGGDGRGALRLGATFDPAFLERAGLRNVKGDVAEARSWYGRALDLGTAAAKRQPNAIETRQDDKFQ